MKYGDKPARMTLNLKASDKTAKQHIERPTNIAWASGHGAMDFSRSKRKCKMKSLRSCDDHTRQMTTCCGLKTAQFCLQTVGIVEMTDS